MHRYAVITLASLFAAAALVTTAIAAAPPNATYTGRASNYDAMTITTNADGTQADIGIVNGNIDGCVGAGTSRGWGISASNTIGGQARNADGSLAPTWLGVVFGDGGAIVGYRDSTPTGAGLCTIKTIFTGDISSGATKGPGIPARTVWRGSVASGIGLGVGGTIELSTGADADVIDRLTIDYKEGSCTYPLEVKDIRLTDGKVFQSGWRTPTNQRQAPSVAGVTRGSGEIWGAFSAPATSTCPIVTGTWTARRVAAQSAATPAPAPGASGLTPATQIRGAGTVSARIPASGIGLTVFAGGTNDQLVSAAGCAAPPAAFWASDGAGGFLTFVPGAAVAVVNATWNAKFATGIPANTPIIGRCT